MTDPHAYEISVIRERASVSTWLAFSFFQPEILAARPPVYLTAAEAQVWRRYVHARRRASFVMGRHAAKRALIAHWGRDAADMDGIGIGSGVFSQPIIQDTKGMTAELSLAHTDGVAAALVSRLGHPVGIDLERVAPERAEVIRSGSVAGDEWKGLDAVRMDDTAKLFGVWTIKEALSKILRCGLMIPFEVLEVVEVVASGSDRTGSMECLFKNFPQYRGKVWVTGEMAMAMVLPKQSRMNFEPGEPLWTAIRQGNRAYQTFICGGTPEPSDPRSRTVR